ncbi:helix-turn-helix domain-containing protein [Anaerobacillus sp. MEB173]|uniref:helix-turn-helix domain-containing protein n=1 Tax=Anaerobacillus sp. MEB173 TaxID=3383345 RepID=UPI003F90CBEE
MKFRNNIILYLIKKFDGNRSLAACYHLLKGKKTSQTIQDGKLFAVSFLFGTLKEIEKQELTEWTKELLSTGNVVEKENGILMITPKGEQQLLSAREKYDFLQKLDGWTYGDSGKCFWDRFSLYFQTLSNLIADKNNFIPITKEQSTLTWVKKHFPSSRIDRNQAAAIIYNEIYQILSSLTEQEATIFLMRLSGCHRIGYTIEQIASILGLEKEYVSVLFQAILHQFVSTITTQKEQFPMLHQFIENGKRNLILTESTAYTYRMIKKGKSIEDIARIRRLKRNTIEDHLVEIAVHDPSFSIEPYVAKAVREKIIEAAGKANSMRLRDIKQLLDDERISYFMIRLVLMVNGGNNR